MPAAQHFEKSLVHATLEAVLAQDAPRRDLLARANRAKAAALIECAEKGYAKLTMRGIAARARVSTASLYVDYKDRDGLLVAALELLLDILAQDEIALPADGDPIARVRTLLLAHGQAFADPFATWLFRLHIHSAWSGNPHLFARASGVQDKIERTWNGFWRQLIDEGHLQGVEPRMLSTLMLGAVERATILGALAFADQPDDGSALAAVVDHAVAALFEVWGTADFWVARGGHPRGPKGAALASSRTMRFGEAKPIMSQPSARLERYARKVLGQEIDRFDAASRLDRVRLAVLLECKELGYEKASVAGVAHRAGVSTATLYKEFPDKQALFVHAFATQARFLPDYGELTQGQSEPQDIVFNQIVNNGASLSDPGFAWYHVTAMASEISNAGPLMEASRETRSHSEAFWRGLLTRLAQTGAIRACDTDLMANMALGGIQRSSILALLLMGPEGLQRDEVASLARHTTTFIFALLGTEAFWERQADRITSGGQKSLADVLAGEVAD